MTDDHLVSRAVFGLFDGVTGCIGVLAGLIVAHATPTAILATAAGLAVAAAVGMAFGEALSGGSYAQAAVMGVATLAGSLAPALPVAMFYGATGYTVAGILVVAVAVVIAEVRTPPRIVAYLTTFTTLAVASALSAAAALMFGPTG